MAEDNGVASSAYEGDLLQLAALKAVVVVTHKIGLLKAGFAPTPSATWADFDAAKADFGGYAAVAVAAALDPGVDAAGIPLLKLNTANFTSDDGDPANSVTAWYLWDDGAAPKKVLYYGILNNPVAVNKAGQQLQLDIVLREDGETSWNLDY